MGAFDVLPTDKIYCTAKKDIFQKQKQTPKQTKGFNLIKHLDLIHRAIYS